MNCGLSVVLPLDICGAIALKRKLPTLMVYCKQDKDTLIEKILERNCSINEKKLRLLALDQERKNEACNHSYTCWITSLWRSCFISWFFVINYRFFVIIRFQLWLYKYQSFYCCIYFFNHCINFFLSHIWFIKYNFCILYNRIQICNRSFCAFWCKRCFLFCSINCVF